MRPASVSVPAKVEIEYDVDTATVSEPGTVQVTITPRFGRVLLEDGTELFKIPLSARGSFQP